MKMVHLQSLTCKTILDMSYMLHSLDERLWQILGSANTQGSFTKISPDGRTRNQTVGTGQI